MYEDSVKLPSRGLLYEGSPEEVVIRNITTEEEKKMFAATSVDVFDRIIDSCLVEPKGLKVKDLIIADKTYLLMRLRAHTYGNKYNIYSKCPEPSCGEKVEKEVDILEFPVTYLPDDFEEPIKVTLPMRKDELALRFLRGADVMQAEKLAKAYTRKFRQPMREAEYVYRMCLHTQSVNGTKFENMEEARLYFEKLEGRDSAAFWEALNSVEVGVDLTVDYECPYCGLRWEEILPISEEFFRPRYNAYPR